MAEREGSSLFGEVRRLARTSGAVGGIAARITGERVFGIKTDKARHAEDLKTVLGGMKGPLMKVAQFLSTVPDALPEEYAAQLAELQSNAPPMGWVFVRRRMQSELGANWETKFKSFTREAVAAASLGQVHRATLPDGREVACKLQYPDMPSVIEADLRQVKLAMAVYKRMDNAIIQDDIYVELSARLREELDYQREAAQMRLYRIMLDHVPDVNVPEPVAEYTTGRLLTMSWLKGVGFKTVAGARSQPGAAQRLGGGLVPGLVYSVLSLWRDPWRSASGQLPGERKRRAEPAGLRLDPRVPAAFRRRRARALCRRARQRPGARPSRL